MTNPAIIELKLNELKSVLSSRFYVSKIGYFGSYAIGNFSEKSDLDILIHLSKPLGWEFFDLQDFLQKELNVNIDLVSVNALKEQMKNSILSQVKYI